MVQPATTADFSRSAVQNFVQTVVFVDDKIYTSDSGKVQGPTVLSGGARRRKPSSKSQTLKPSEEPVVEVVQSLPQDEPIFSSHDIQASFAEKSVVCSLYQPEQNCSMDCDSVTYKLCAAADIIIVDWDLYGDAGHKARELIANVV